MRKSVELATKMRMQNLTHEMVARIIQEKIDLAQYESMYYLRDDFCSESVIMTFYRQTALNNMLDRLIGNTSIEVITDEDINAGFTIYSATVFCSNTPKQPFREARE